LGEAGFLVLQLFSTGGDFAGASPQFGQLDESALVEVQQAAAFGVGGGDIAVQPGQFGGEQFVVGDRGAHADRLFPDQQLVGLVIAARMWSNTSASARMLRSGRRRDSPPALSGSWLQQQQ
jgi:hypothetical protein